MDTQNVSAQLYFKQLPEDKNAGSYNCFPTYPNLSTCVETGQSDISLEVAFQKQLDLSEYYKSPGVFEVMKKDFMDETMEGQREPSATPTSTYPAPPSVKQRIPVGPTDFLKRYIKEGFGGTGSSIGFFLVFVIIIVAIYFYLKK